METVHSHPEKWEPFLEKGIRYIERSSSARAALIFLENGPGKLLCGPSVVQALLKHGLIELHTVAKKSGVVKISRNIHAITTLGMQVLEALSQKEISAVPIQTLKHSSQKKVEDLIRETSSKE